MNRLSTSTLVKVACLGGAFTASVGYLMLDSLVSGVQSSPYYALGMETLREHPGARRLVGEPIKAHKFSESLKENYCDGRRAHFRVPVTGPHCAADYEFWAEYDPEAARWTVTRAELYKRSEPDKMLVIVAEQ